MNTNLIERTEQTKNMIDTLNISIKLAQQHIDFLESEKKTAQIIIESAKKAAQQPVEKPITLTERQIQFSRDDCKALINKYKNKTYENYKNQILAEVKKKYFNAKEQKEKNDAKLAMYEKFIEEVRSEFRNSVK